VHLVFRPRGVGLEPACVKTCPTGAIGFGTKEDMVAYGEKRADELKERGFQNAGLYNPQGWAART
jgi:formate dehydrogenase iron-sulfur subunit